jgi:hypothetical protein
MKRSLLAASVVLFGVITPPLVAQASDDEAAAMAAAVSAIMTKVPPGKTVIVYNDRTAELSKRLGEKIGKKIGHENTMLDCQDDIKLHRKRCALKNASSLVNIGSITVSGDAAVAYLFIESPSGSEWQPIETDGYVVKLARVKGAWSVVSINLAVV